MIYPTPILSRRYSNVITETLSDFPGQVFQYYTEGGTKSWSGYREGYSNPDWRQKVALGLDTSSKYVVRRFIGGVPSECICDQANYTQYPNSKRDFHCRSSYFGDVLGAVNSNNADDLTLRDKALTSLKRKLSSHYVDVNLMLPLVELRDLHELITSSAHLATGLLKTLIDIKRTKGRSALKYASRAWLAFNFGFKPLLADTHTACDAISNFLLKQQHTVRLSGTASKTWSGVQTPVQDTGSGGSQIFTTFSADHSLSYRYIGGFDVSIKSANNYGAVRSLTTDFKDLPSTLWELVPYSWAVDYFTNIGAYLSDTFVLPPGDLKYLVLDRRYTMKGQCRSSHKMFPPWVKTREVATTGSMGYYDFSRTPLTTLPRIGLHIKMQSDVGLFAVSKLLNLATILLK